MVIKWKNCIRIGISVFVLFLCIHFLDDAIKLFSVFFKALAPVIAGCIVAYVVNILMSGYERRLFSKTKKARLKKLKTPLCLILAYLTLFAIVALVVMLVLPQFVKCIKLIVSQLPDFMDRTVAFIESRGFLSEDILSKITAIDWKTRIGDIIEMFTPYVENVFEAVMTTVSSVSSAVVSVFLAFIFSIYLLLSKKSLSVQADKLMKRYLKPNASGKINYVVSVFNDSFHNYIVGQCTEAVILGTLCTIGMLLLRLPYATMIGALIAITAIIPIAGAYIGAFVGAFMIATVSPVKALIFLIFLVVLQQIEGNFIYPKVVGSSIGLPGIWVLFAITVGGGMFGITGMFLGVPLVAAVYRFVKEDVIRADKKTKDGGVKALSESESKIAAEE